MPRRRRKYQLINAVNRIDEDIRSILRKRQSTRYFEGIIVMYSLIENVLKWLVFVKITWNKVDRTLPTRELESLMQFCNQQDFYSVLNLALVTDLINHPLFNKINKVRIERNDAVHQCYLLEHRKNARILRAKLQRLVGIADSLFVVFNELVEETGMDPSYEIFKVKRKKVIAL
jgi:hypothetical protein